jgi:hypothetical protein
VTPSSSKLTVRAHIGERSDKRLSFEKRVLVPKQALPLHAKISPLNETSSLAGQYGEPQWMAG